MEEILTSEDIQFLKELSHELKTQDNLGTAKPLIFKIAEPEIKWNLDHENNSKHVAFNIDLEIYTDSEAIAHLNDTYDLNLPADLDHEKIKEIFDINSEVYTEVYGVEEIICKGEFLTNKSAKEHLKNNAHHYNEHSRIYIDRAWRNPILDKLLQIIEKF